MPSTRYLKINPLIPEPDIIEIAAQLIKSGEVIAFPTETVYGLGADTFQPLAVEKIFLAKGRPQERPLLVHISNVEQVAKLSSIVSGNASKLMEHFWPGPLSIILPARAEVPSVVRGGGFGVGLRMPSHPVALALIEATGPLAAPSANLYGRPSPTNAEHVREDLDNIIAAVLDAGETGSGLESTIIDLCSRPYQILRRGGVQQAAIEECLGEEVNVTHSSQAGGFQTKLKIRLCVDGNELNKLIIKQHELGQILGLIILEDNCPDELELVEHIFQLDISEKNFNLYPIMRKAEAVGIDLLLVAPLTEERIGTAVMDRLRRAVMPR
jgi:L-threonylcarbamoyladenylate synthase